MCIILYATGRSEFSCFFVQSCEEVAGHCGCLKNGLNLSGLWWLSLSYRNEMTIGPRRAYLYLGFRCGRSRGASFAPAVFLPDRTGRGYQYVQYPTANQSVSRVAITGGLCPPCALVEACRAGQGTILFEPGDAVKQVYFPQTGMISLLRVMQNGKAIETATIGHESAIGIMTGFGTYTTLARATVQLRLTGMQIAAARFRKATYNSAALQGLISKHRELLLFQTQTIAACNALHLIEPRFCRWILQASDRSEGDLILLTQELLSQMLGVRRASVNEVANKLQAAGVIEYARGTVKIVNRKRLKSLSCECYGTLLANTAKILKQK